MDNHYDQGRRKFLKNSGIVGLPCLLPAALLKNNTVHHQVASKNKQAINFITDMPLRNASEYLGDLQSALANEAAPQDFYGGGGIVRSLEKKFAALSGKERALFLCTATQASQVFIKRKVDRIK